MSDEEQIRRQLSRWMQLDDGYRDEEWITEILADDFSFSVGDQTFVGKDVIRELNKARDAGPARGTHILSEPVISIAGSGDAATVTTDYVYFTAAPEGGYAATTVGQYTDELVRDADGVWRVRSRVNVHLVSGRTAAP